MSTSSEKSEPQMDPNGPTNNSNYFRLPLPEKKTDFFNPYNDMPNTENESWSNRQRAKDGKPIIRKGNQMIVTDTEEPDYYGWDDADTPVVDPMTEEQKKNCSHFKKKHSIFQES